MVYLYTLQTCPICNMVKIKLKQKNITFEEKDLSEISSLLNIDRAPVLDIGNENYLTSPQEIVAWINKED